MSDFHKEIRRLEWAYDEGMWADQILDHTNSKVVGGNTLPPVDEVINDYKILLDPTATRVIAEGSNNNLLDVQIANGVSLGVTAFGVGGSALTDEQANNLLIIKSILEGDVIPESVRFRILHKSTKEILVDKVATEVNGLTQLTE